MLLLKRAAFSVCLILAVLICTGCPDSKTVVTKVHSLGDEEKRPPLNGVFYALPRTAIKVDIPLVRKDLEPGQFAKFTPVFFPDEDYIEKKATKFSIGKPVFATQGEPDPDEIYLVQTLGGRFETKTLLLDYNDAGVLTKADSKSEDQTLEFTTGTIKTVASIVAPLLPLAGDPTKRSAIIRFDRNQLPTDQEFENNLSPAQLEWYKSNIKQPLENACRNGNQNDCWNYKEEQKFYKSLDPSERDFYIALTTAERAIYRSLTLEQADFYRGLSAAERADFDTLAATEREFYRLVEKPEFRKYYISLKTPGERDDFQKALEAYNRIQDLKKKQETLLQPPATIAPLPVETLKEMLKQLQTLIDDTKSGYFMGTVETANNSIGTFEYRPPTAQPLKLARPVLTEKEPEMKVDLFEFSSARGVCHVQDGQGIKVPDKFYLEKKVCPGGAATCAESEKKDEACTDTTLVSLRVTREPKQFSTTVREAEFDDHGKRGFYYRIPGQALAVVYLGEQLEKNEKGRARLTIAQLGVTASLPATTKGRRTSYTLELYPETGALKNFNMGSDAAVQKSLVDDLSGTASDVIAARQKQQEQKKEANKPPDELQDLERQRMILEERNKILDEQDKLKKRTSP
jgi:hypothetical protein